MKNASLWALTGAALVVGIAYACAVPVDVTGCPAGPSTRPDCDIILTPSYEFGAQDASVGGNAGSSNMDPPSGGSAGSGSPPPGGSTSNPPPSGGSAGQGQAGSGQTAGASGSAGTAGAGGSAGSGTAGAGGSAGSAGSGAAGTSAAGAGGTATQSNFSVEACDFDNRAGCEAFACATACPSNMGTYCTTNCPLIITCVADNVDTGCVTEQDPMCAARNGGNVSACTNAVETSGGATTTNANDPAFRARALVQCLCADPRP